ncbi:MAG TPA: Stp1/IreP family PP2C-type Ser/Thr phosphatase [Blastocatellia bacterium]|nr:Stp1/IreP family PP2C-type Ser/Thr phosphatase [Blastocatellia bacterium]
MNDDPAQPKEGGLSEYKVVASLRTDVGCVREINEDSGKYVQPNNPEVLASKGMLFVVADGMGGHSAGEVASSIAVETVSRVYYDDKNDPEESLRKAFQQANRDIHAVSVKNASLSGMGTTCTALVLKDGTALSAHVGDSRIYLVRDGQIYVMTEDHSAVMEMVKRGLISHEEARYHPDKNIILRAVGSQPDVEVSSWEEPFPVKASDQFVLCSDGLYDLVTDEEIKDAVLSADPHVACEGLISLAKERGGYDNITVGIIRLQPPGDKSSGSVKETREAEVLR